MQSGRRCPVDVDRRRCRVARGPSSRCGERADARLQRPEPLLRARRPREHRHARGEARALVGAESAASVGDRGREVVGVVHAEVARAVARRSRGRPGCRVTTLGRPRMRRLDDRETEALGERRADVRATRWHRPNRSRRPTRRRARAVDGRAPRAHGYGERARRRPSRPVRRCRAVPPSPSAQRRSNASSTVAWPFRGSSVPTARQKGVAGSSAFRISGRASPVRGGRQVRAEMGPRRSSRRARARRSRACRRRDPSRPRARCRRCRRRSESSRGATARTRRGRLDGTPRDGGSGSGRTHPTTRPPPRRMSSNTGRKSATWVQLESSMKSGRRAAARRDFVAEIAVGRRPNVRSAKRSARRRRPSSKRTSSTCSARIRRRHELVDEVRVTTRSMPVRGSAAAMRVTSINTRGDFAHGVVPARGERELRGRAPRAVPRSMALESSGDDQALIVVAGLEDGGGVALRDPSGMMVGRDLGARVARRALRARRRRARARTSAAASIAARDTPGNAAPRRRRGRAASRGR